MRTRNIKLNIFLNEYEQKMLKEKSSKAKLSQSDFIRNLLENYSDKNILKEDIKYTISSLSEIYKNLIILSNKLNHLQYYTLVNFLDKQINEINSVIKKLSQFIFL